VSRSIAQVDQGVQVGLAVGPALLEAVVALALAEDDPDADELDAGGLVEEHFGSGAAIATVRVIVVFVGSTEVPCAGSSAIT
jgi:hypothetical protein